MRQIRPTKLHGFAAIGLVVSLVHAACPRRPAAGHQGSWRVPAVFDARQLGLVQSAEKSVCALFLPVPAFDRQQAGRQRLLQRAISEPKRGKWQTCRAWRVFAATAFAGGAEAFARLAVAECRSRSADGDRQRHHWIYDRRDVREGSRRLQQSPQYAATGREGGRSPLQDRGHAGYLGAKGRRGRRVADHRRCRGQRLGLSARRWPIGGERIQRRPQSARLVARHFRPIEVARDKNCLRSDLSGLGRPGRIIRQHQPWLQRLGDSDRNQFGRHEKGPFART